MRQNEIMRVKNQITQKIYCNFVQSFSKNMGNVNGRQMKYRPKTKKE